MNALSQILCNVPQPNYQRKRIFQDSSEKSNVSIQGIGQAKCNKHSSRVIRFCKPCSQELCKHCRHSQENHEIIDFDTLQSHYTKDSQSSLDEIDNLKKKLNSNSDSLRDSIYIDETSRMSLHKAHDALSTYMKTYFEEFQELFQRIVSRGKSKDWGENLFKEICELENEINTSKNPNSFYKRNIEKKLQSLKEEAKIIEKSSNSFVPTIVISPAELLHISFCLGQYASIIPSSNNIYNSMKTLRINMPNTFFPELEPFVAIPNYSKEELLVYRFSNSNQETFHMSAFGTVFPEEPTLITLPNGDIYITGGLTDGNFITSQVLKCSLFESLENNCEEGGFKEVQLISVEKMKVARIAHSLTFHRGYIYAVGGCTSEKVKTSSCERLKIQDGTWELISELNIGRSRTALCSYGESHIYAFFGANNEGSTTMKVEKYNVPNDKWTLISLCNLPHVFSVALASSIQINEDQILIFGGIYEGAENKGNPIPSRKALLFSASEEVFISLGDILPMSHLHSQNPILHQKEIFSLSFFVKSMNPFTKILDSEFLISIKNKGDASVHEILHF